MTESTTPPVTNPDLASAIDRIRINCSYSEQQGLAATTVFTEGLAALLSSHEEQKAEIARLTNEAQEADELCAMMRDQLTAAQARIEALEKECQLKELPSIQIDADLELIDGFGALMARGQLTQPRNVGNAIRQSVKKIRALLTPTGEDDRG